MAQHPRVYAEMLGRKIAQHEVTCWLVNTGWTGGSYGAGSRMKIAHTRAMITAALAGSWTRCHSCPIRSSAFWSR